jgi:hypothetical protein
MGCGNNDMMNFVIFIAFVLFCVVIFMIMRKPRQTLKTQMVDASGKPLFNANGQPILGQGEDDVDDVSGGVDGVGIMDF